MIQMIHETCGKQKHKCSNDTLAKILIIKSNFN
jgi:hypothetical protein